MKYRDRSKNVFTLTQQLFKLPCIHFLEIALKCHKKVINQCPDFFTFPLNLQMKGYEKLKLLSQHTIYTVLYTG